MNDDVPDVALHCELCSNALLTIEHIMVECEQLGDTRRACPGKCNRNRTPNVGDLFGTNINIFEIVSFFEEYI